MMWSVPGKPSTVLTGEFKPQSILYEFDGPRVFTLVDNDDELYLGCWSDEDAVVSRYVVVPTTTRIIQALTAGELSVLDALDQPRCWLCDVTHEGTIDQCLRVDFFEIPSDALPARDTLLLSSLRPVSTVTAPGKEG